MLHIVNAPEDAKLADRLKADLQKAGYKVNGDLPKEAGHILIAVLSGAGNNNQTVQGMIIRALDNGQHIIPVLAENVPVPRLINHLSAANFSADYDFAVVQGMVEAASAPDAGRPLKVLTPSAKAANQRIGVWLAILVLVSFIIGIILVGFYGIQAPREEYNSIDTIVAVTIQALVAPNIPRSTADAENFPLTVQAAPSAQRPLLIATSTAQAERNSP